MCKCKTALRRVTFICKYVQIPFTIKLKLNTQNCSPNHKSKRLLKYCLFQCNETEFGCFDGTCVPLVKRCNEIDDCSDGSDEKYCNIISIDPDSYRRGNPPLVSEVDRTPINISRFLYLLIFGRSKSFVI